jgi:glycosyltransferase involved in cell wall biosynthesis
MKISLITVVYNAEQYIADCIQSVIGQTYRDIEYLIIDGGSTDHTLDVIKSYSNHIDYFISEKDRGLYDALNKGIAAATGEVIGILNADDILASPLVIEKIAEAFKSQSTDAIYGNLNYVNASNPLKIIRKWVGRAFVLDDFKKGWMPAHPTLYLKRELFQQFGEYSLHYGTAADYELILRFLYHHHVKAVYLDLLMVNMRVGGVSNASFAQRYRAFLNDYRAAKSNGIPFALGTVLFKKLGKISQYFAK